MLLRWRLLYGCAIIVPSLRRLPRALFLLAWRGLPRFQRGSPFRPWLMRILYRHALDAMEKYHFYGQPVSLNELTDAEMRPGSAYAFTISTPLGRAVCG